MSRKIVTAVAAALLLASTGLASAASAKTHAVRHNENQHRYYNMVPVAPDPAPNTDTEGSRFYPFPVTGQSGV